MAEKLVVRPHRPGRVPMAVTGVVVLVLVVGAVAYLVGLRHFDRAMVEKREQVRELRRLRAEVAELRRSEANWDIARQVDRASLEQVRREVASLEGRLAEQREELELYRNLLKDSGEASGLYVDALEIGAGSDNRHPYRLVVRNKSALSKPVSVVVSVAIDGSLSGQARRLSYGEVDPEAADGSRPLSFKYFKVLKGTFALPPGFEPATVTVRVARRDERDSVREKTFPWSVTEV